MAPPARPGASRRRSRRATAEPIGGSARSKVESTIREARWRRVLTGLEENERLELVDGLLEQLDDERGKPPEQVTDRLLDPLIASKRGEAEIRGARWVLGGG